MSIDCGYGFWDSPITARLLSSSGLLLESHFGFAGERIYFVERRPGRDKEALVSLDLSDLSVFDILPSSFGVRSRVHEYGGAAFTVCEDGGVIFVEGGSQDIIYYDGVDFRALVKGDRGDGIFCRFGDLHYDSVGERIIAVAELHGGDGVISNELWFIGLDGRVVVAVSGSDFYASPTMSFDGKRLSWLQWEHPYMAWDSAVLMESCVLSDGSLCDVGAVCGGHLGVSCFQPQYDSLGNLYFICDNGAGFWQLHCRRASGEVMEFPLKDGDEWVECGFPLWQLGMRVYDFVDAFRVLLCGSCGGVWHLYLLDIRSGEWRRVASDYCYFEGLRCRHGRGYFLGSSVYGGACLVEIDLRSEEVSERVLRRTQESDIDRDYISVGELKAFSDGMGGCIYGYYYGPVNKDYVCSRGLPPLLLRCHGGPTAAAHSGFSGKVQYWTSRGFAVFDLNYRGSTGFGRDYRESLYGHWGLYDSEDCCISARGLVAEGLADGDRLFISGSSAGGFTVLSALAFRDVFCGGCSIYGIGDLVSLSEETHKYESHYLSRLVGGDVDEYRRRSPYYSAGEIDCPVLFLQGAEDVVVPPSQMFAMVEALRERGTPCEYELFEGEGHGFRRAANIERALTLELEFYRKLLL